MMTTWNPTTLDSFDTGASIWQKLNQLGFFVPDTEAPPLVDGQQYFRSADGTWHTVDLVEEAGMNATRVWQDASESPGNQYIGYVVLTASDATNHKLSVVLEGDVYTLEVDQEETDEDGFSSVTLTAPSGSYPLTVVLDGGIYTVTVGQPVPSTAVSDLFKSDSNPDVDLTWTDTGEGIEAEIYRSTNGGADFTLLAILSSPTDGAYSDAGVQSSHDYADLRYKLRYTGIGGNGPYSNVV